MLTVEKIREVLKETDSATNVDAIGNDDLLSDAGIDSLDIFSVFLRFEEITGIEVSDEDVDNLKTINSILEFYNTRS